MNFLLICLGGSLGALSRFYLSSLIEKQEYIEIPLGIMTVNILGCFFLGLFYNLINSDLERILNPFLFIGFLGAFATFSAFSKESLELINNGHILSAFFYVSISVFACLGSTWLGMALMRGN